MAAFESDNLSIQTRHAATIKDIKKLKDFIESEGKKKAYAFRGYWI